jgi:hypothetical protein
MSANAIASDLRAYAVRRWPTANHKFRKARLADLLGFSERRVRSFWEATAASPRDDEVDAINALLGQKEGADEGAYEAMAARLAAMEADYAELRAEMDRVRLALEGREEGGQGGASDGRGIRLYGRRAGDVPEFTDADERTDQSQGWGR